jgi:hypothetical protein
MVVARSRRWRSVGCLRRRWHAMLPNSAGAAVRFPCRIQERLQAALDLRDRQAAGPIRAHGRAGTRGRIDKERADAVFPLTRKAAKERLAQQLWNHCAPLRTFVHGPGLDAPERASRVGHPFRRSRPTKRTRFALASQLTA